MNKTMTTLEKELEAKNIQFDDESINSGFPVIFCKSIKKVEKIANKYGYKIFDAEYDDFEEDYVITLERE